MKKISRVLALIMVMVTLSVSLCGCGAKSEVKDKIKQFETACQKMDVNGILDCVDPSVSDPIRLGLVLANSILGDEGSEAVGEIIKEVVVSLFGDRNATEEYLTSIKITDIKPQVEDNYAIANCVISYTASGQAYQKVANISLRKSNEVWYITDIDVVGDK